MPKQRESMKKKNTRRMQKMGEKKTIRGGKKRQAKFAWALFPRQENRGTPTHRNKRL